MALSSLPRGKAIGKSNEGQIVRVFHNRNSYALKIQDLDAQQEIDTSLLREVACLRRCQHPNVIQLYSASIEDGKFYLLMPLATCDFNQVIYRKWLSVEEKVKYTYQLMDGVNYLHTADIYHLDLKPQNLVLIENQLKIIDFGLSHPFASVPNTPLRAEVTTIWYRAPEILANLHSRPGSRPIYNANADKWSVGTIIYELFAREPLFPGQDDDDQLDLIDSRIHLLGFWKDVEIKMANCPPEIVRMTLELIRFRPGHRPNLADLLSDLAARQPLMEKSVDTSLLPRLFTGGNWDRSTGGNWDRSTGGNWDRSTGGNWDSLRTGKVDSDSDLSSVSSRDNVKSVSSQDSRSSSTDLKSRLKQLRASHGPKSVFSRTTKLSPSIRQRATSVSVPDITICPDYEVLANSCSSVPDGQLVPSVSLPDHHHLTSQTLLLLWALRNRSPAPLRRTQMAFIFNLRPWIFQLNRIFNGQGSYFHAIILLDQLYEKNLLVDFKQSRLMATCCYYISHRYLYHDQSNQLSPTYLELSEFTGYKVHEISDQVAAVLHSLSFNLMIATSYQYLQAYLETGVSLRLLISLYHVTLMPHVDFLTQEQMAGLVIQDADEDI